MGKQERKIARMLGIKNSNEESHPFRNSALMKDWYLDKIWEKIVFVLGFIALVWTIIERLFLGRW